MRHPAAVPYPSLATERLSPPLRRSTGGRGGVTVISISWQAFCSMIRTGLIINV